MFHTQVDIKLPLMHKQWKLNNCDISSEAAIDSIIVKTQKLDSKHR